MPPPPPAPTDPANLRYFVRRAGGATTGPHTKAALAMMFVTGALQGDEGVSTDRQTWRPIRGLGADDEPAAAPPPAGRGPGGASPRDLGGGGDGEGEDMGAGDLSLAPLEIGFGADP